MEKLYFEIPSLERKYEAIEYINEHYEYKSDIDGSGGLHRYLNNYEGWLDKLEKDYTMTPSEERVAARTYFLVRESDNRIIGMINIRTALNERLSKFGGHIGYGIRPTERGKEYYNEDEKCMIVDYNIDVKNALEKYKEIYEPYVSNGKVK